MSKIKVMIVDDQELIRESLQVMLELDESIEIVASVKNGQEALEHYKTLEPHVILMDVRMPIMDGVLATREIKRLNREVKIIILTTFNEDEYIFNAIKEGANGYLLKDISAEKLRETIKSVYNGGSPLTPEVSTKLLNRFAEMARSFDEKSAGPKIKPDLFSERELDIIRLVAKGLSNKEIGDTLYISEGTVRNHISNILAKVDLKDRTQLAVFAYENRIISS